MATAPAFAATPASWVARISVANTGRDGTGTIVPLNSTSAAPTGGGVTYASGCRPTSITAIAETTVTSGMLRLFRSSDSGTTWKLWREIPVLPIASPSATVVAWTTVISLLDTAGNAPSLGAADRIGASMHNAEAVVLVTEAPAL